VIREASRYHCGNVPYVSSPDSAWPLRRGDGTRLCDPATPPEEKETEQ
jgi:hypothetical protein